MTVKELADKCYNEVSYEDCNNDKCPYKKECKNFKGIVGASLVPGTFYNFNLSKWLRDELLNMEV